MEAARTGSLFASRRAVVVRNADALKGDGEEMVAYLQDPSPDAALILMAAKPDKREDGLEGLMAARKVVPADPLKGRPRCGDGPRRGPPAPPGPERRGGRRS